MTRIVQSTAAREAREGNATALVSRASRWRRVGLAAGAGLLLTLAFAPANVGPLAWLALLPLLAVGLRVGARAWWLGYLFGFVHTATTLGWLRVTMPPASWFYPLGLAAILAVYPACWLWLMHRLHALLARPERADVEPRHGQPTRRDESLSPGAEIVFMLLAGAAWCAGEWLRGWAFTGFPWNLLGVSQWQAIWLLPVTRFTGVYGLSFLIVAVNVALFLAARELLARRRGATRPLRPWPLAVAAGLLLLAVLSRFAYSVPEPLDHVRVLAIQGNLPEMRAASEQNLEDAVETYFGLTREGVAAHQPDLVLWPETAVPDYIIQSRRVSSRFVTLVNEMERPFIVGSVYRDYEGIAEGEGRERNSVFCITSPFQIAERYDKMHPVPFGEYVPFGDRYPQLDAMFGMGRRIVPGREYTTYAFRPDVRLGFAICFEDVFADCSRGMALHGATHLVTITNDAWYNETAGSAQHLAHAVFRSVETLRPMMRNGNNSDTCIILPDGRLVNRLRDPQTGSTFTRQAALYDLPVYPPLPLTVYTRFGDVFAWLCALATVLTAGTILRRSLSRRQRLRALVGATDDDPDSP